MATYKLLAKDLMTAKVVCVYPETSIRDLIKVLTDYRVNGVPVVDRKENPIGVVSKTDILGYTKEKTKKQDLGSKKSFYTDTNGRQTKAFDMVTKEKDFGKATVKDIMTPHVIAAEATDTIDRLAKIMYNKKIHRLIIQDGGRVVGIVSTLDILHVVGALNYGSNAFVSEKAILGLRKRLEAAEKSIQSLRSTFDKIYS